MRILLINPPNTYPKKYFTHSDIRVSMPLGLLYIAGMLQKEGYNPRMLDAFTLGGKLEISEDEKTIHVGASFERLRQEVRREKPDLVGITNQFTSQVENAIEMSKIVREEFPEVPIIMGGPHASVLPFELLDYADVAVMGEGEDTAVALMQHYDGDRPLSDIPGIAYRDREGKEHINPRQGFIQNLDEIPIPPYDLIDLEVYFDAYKKGYNDRPYIKSERVLSMRTSRSCPFNCVFCSIHLHMGRGWRAHSAEYVLDYLEHVVTKYRVKHISFEDDNLTLNKKRFEAILDGMLERDIHITWDTPNGVRADKLDRNLIRKSKKTGCIFFVIGVESGDQWVLDNVVDKHLRLEDVINTAKICKEEGIGLSAFYVIGMPGEKKENIMRTLRFALWLDWKYDVYPSLSIASPLIGTRLYEISKKNGYLVEEPTWENLIVASRVYGKGLIKTPDFSPEDLAKWGKSFYRKFILIQALKPRTWLNALKEPGIYLRLARNALRKSGI